MGLRQLLLLFLFSIFLTTSEWIAPALAEDEIPIEEVSEDEFADEELIYEDTAGDKIIYDPIEGFNRAIFTFNDTVDVYFLEPVARGYRFITPDFVETGVSNFLTNLNYPQYLISDLLQLKVGQVFSHTGRFLINSTVGVAGFFDVAQYVGLEDHYEDFGVGLGYNGVPPGPYLVLPFLGPSNVRDGFGRIVDGFAHPAMYFEYSNNVEDDVALAITYGHRTTEIIDARAGLIDAIETAKESSLDYYAFVRAAYMQRRQGYIDDGASGDDFADEFDDEFGDDFDEELEDEFDEELNDETEMREGSETILLVPESLLNKKK